MVNKYQKNNEKLQKEAHERYQNLSQEEKGKKHRTKNLSEKEKQRKVEYMRNYYLTHKKSNFRVL